MTLATTALSPFNDHAHGGVQSDGVHPKENRDIAHGNVQNDGDHPKDNPDPLTTWL
jgi:hypothetical protein